MKSITIEIAPEVLAELEYMVELHQQYGAPNPRQSVAEMLKYVTGAIADGSRRPGSWERELLAMMGLVAQCDEHRAYRSSYGKPQEIEIER